MLRNNVINIRHHIEDSLAEQQDSMACRWSLLDLPGWNNCVDASCPHWRNSPRKEETMVLEENLEDSYTWDSLLRGAKQRKIGTEPGCQNPERNGEATLLKCSGFRLFPWLSPRCFYTFNVTQPDSAKVPIQKHCYITSITHISDKPEFSCNKAMRSTFLSIHFSLKNCFSWKWCSCSKHCLHPSPAF